MYITSQISSNLD